MVGEGRDLLDLVLLLVQSGQGTAMFPGYTGLMAKLLPSTTTLASLYASSGGIYSTKKKKKGTAPTLRTIPR